MLVIDARRPLGAAIPKHPMKSLFAAVRLRQHGGQTTTGRANMNPFGTVHSVKR